MKIFASCLSTLLLMPLLFTAQLASAAEDSVSPDFGPGILNIRSQSIAQSFRLTLPLMVPGDIPRGWQVFSQATWTNVWAEDPTYLLDYEMLDTTLGFSYGISDRFGVSVVMDNRRYFGGEMDGFIQGFHDAAGIGQNGRDNYSKGRSAITIFDPATGNVVEERSPGDLNNTGVSLLVNYTLLHSHPLLPDVNIYGVARYAFETADIISHGDEVDTGAGIGFAKQVLPGIHAYGILGYTLYGSQEASAKEIIDLKSYQVTGLFALAWQATPKLSAVGQYLYSSSVVEKIGGLKESSHEVHLGLKYKVSPRTGLNVSLIENIITMDNSPDFGLHVGWFMRL
ncbi:DUF3187 family protein [Desulfoluna butyratoxydans]|uniref:DUF3187 family protein n=1 Tax=Desulfoluna butyratoxydans TaxID=231438 RepID=A0A4U8YHR9_9BACT|nr:DUF3187 family protein [Desulfoluna butyratoxydans]VFQ42509.1 protein of unknown function duf3187 [Desulfoluna butyratoxydans]